MYKVSEKKSKGLNYKFKNVGTWIRLDAPIRTCRQLFIILFFTIPLLFVTHSFLMFCTILGGVEPILFRNSWEWVRG